MDLGHNLNFGADRINATSSILKDKKWKRSSGANAGTLLIHHKATQWKTFNLTFYFTFHTTVHVVLLLCI